MGVAQIIVIAAPEQLEPGSDMEEALRAVHAAHKGELVLVTASTDTEHAKMIIQYFDAQEGVAEPQVCRLPLRLLVKAVVLLFTLDLALY